MSRKTFITFLLAAVVLIAGICYAVMHLYSDAPKGEEVLPSGHFIENHKLIKAVPSDAAIVFCFKDFKKACEYLSDTTATFGKIASDKFDKISRGNFPSLRKAQAIMSVHYSKDIPPLLVIEYDAAPVLDSLGAPADTTDDVRRLLATAQESGLHTKLRNGLAMISSSETVISSSTRHLAEGHSILESNGFKELASDVRGDDAILINSDYTENLASAFFARKHFRKSDFVKELSKWTSLSIAKRSDNGVLMQGEVLYGDDPSSYLNIINDGASTASAAEAVPSHADFVASMPVANIGKYIKSYRSYLDSKIKLETYESTLRDQQHNAGKTAEDWAKALDIKEVAIAYLHFEDNPRQVLLVKPGARKFSVNAGEEFPYSGFAKSLFGELFTASSEDSCAVVNGWIVIGERPCVEDYSKMLESQGSLKDCLSDNGLEDRIPQKNCGFWMYYSMSEDPTLLDASFSPLMAKGLRNVVKGVQFAPATLAAISDGGRLRLKLAVDRTSISKSKAPVMEDRDTAVVVPGGPFKVTNCGTGKTNTFYQNSHLSLCLQDENGKDSWGVPFKQKICGFVEEIDYFNNGKIQFLFAAGSQIYLMDRLGRFVGGFPVDLGKKIVLGPAVHDFTGAKGYTAMFLFRDNTVGMFDLHGNPASGWKGISVGETIKSLPELLEANGNKYWIVRTSRQAMLFPFNGGDPVVKGEGEKMIRPESTITIDEKGSATAKCYDGKERSFKMAK